VLTDGTAMVGVVKQKKKATGELVKSQITMGKIAPAVVKPQQPAQPIYFQAPVKPSY